MLTHKEASLAALAHRVCTADAASSAILRNVASATCKRGQASRQSARLAQLQHFIDDGALIDASLAMIELELPAWSLRRIAYDDGKWHCGLSRHRELPHWLDDAVETSHASLPLALLGAYVEALQQFDSDRVALRPSVPLTQPGSHERLCCENFS
jgi:hypothetical protein